MRAPAPLYHGGRLLSYTLLGGICGWLGEPVISRLTGPYGKIAPWAMALVLLLLAFGLEKRIPQPRWLSHMLIRARLRQSLGLFTPLLPCGPLWMIAGVAVTSGSALAGALLLAAFTLGTIPLFWLLQTQALRLQGSVSPFALRWSQRGIALTSALILCWRASFSPVHHCCCP
jgi:sulfite exporter TauE/SafE